MSSPRALLVGGTGPTGPHMLRGLVDRGYDVQMFHTGRHELPDQPDVPHIHGDPYTAKGIADAVGDQEFDVVIATYGRVRLLATHLAGKCRQFLFVGGTPVYEGMVHPEALEPPGLRTPVRETDRRVSPDRGSGEGYGVAAIRRVEDAVFGLGAEGAFDATVFRYPTIYGPRNPHPWEWTVVGRALDRRPFILVPDDGRGTHSRCGAQNAAHSVLLALDRPAAAAGKAYNVADDQVVSIKQWAQITARIAADRLGASPVPVRSFPGAVPQPGWGMIAFGYRGTPNCIVDTSAIKADLGYADVQGLEDGLADVVEEMLADPDSYRNHPNNVDPFDYATEDRMVAAWDGMFAELTRLSLPLGEGLTRMPTPQTASGSGSAESGSVEERAAGSASVRSASARSASAESGSAGSGSVEARSAGSGSVRSASAESGSAGSGSVEARSAGSGSVRSASAGSADSGSAGSAQESRSVGSGSAGSGEVPSDAKDEDSEHRRAADPNGPAKVVGSGPVPAAVTDYFEAMNTEDWDNLRRVLDVDVVIRPPGEESIRGREAAISYYQGVLDNYREHDDLPTRFLVAGDVVSVNIDYSGRTTDYVDVAFKAVDIFTVTDGMVSDVQMWFDTLAVRRMFKG